MTTAERMRAAIASRNTAKPVTPRAPVPPAPRTPPHEREDNRHATKGRLPDGARFEMSYDAAARTWSGTLTVAGREYSGSARGVFRLLVRLDDLYRAAMCSAATKCDATPK